jgi:hypothetical protein
VIRPKSSDPPGNFFRKVISSFHPLLLVKHANLYGTRACGFRSGRGRRGDPCALRSAERNWSTVRSISAEPHLLRPSPARHLWRGTVPQMGADHFCYRSGDADRKALAPLAPRSNLIRRIVPGYELRNRLQTRRCRGGHDPGDFTYKITPNTISPQGY